MMKNVFYQIHIFLNRGELNKYLVSYKGTERLSDSEKRESKQRKPILEWCVCVCVSVCLCVCVSVLGLGQG